MSYVLFHHSVRILTACLALFASPAAIACSDVIEVTRILQLQNESLRPSSPDNPHPEVLFGGGGGSSSAPTAPGIAIVQNLAAALDEAAARPHAPATLADAIADHAVESRRVNASALGDHARALGGVTDIPTRARLRTLVDSLDFSNSSLNLAQSLAHLTPEERITAYVAVADRLHLTLNPRSLSGPSPTVAGITERLFTELNRALSRDRRAAQSIHDGFARIGIDVPLRQAMHLVDEMTAGPLGRADIESRAQALTTDLASRRPASRPRTAAEASERLIEADRTRYVASTAARGSTPTPTPGVVFSADGGVVAVVAEEAARARRGGHTVDHRGGRDYIARHIGEPMMRYLVAHPEIAIDIYGSVPNEVRARLNAQGFTDVRVLDRNRVTDFEVWVVRNPTTGETRMVTVAPRGRAYTREATAHFLHYADEAGGTIATSRVHVFRDSVAPREEFGRVFAEHHLDPDVVIAGNVAQNQRLLVERGGRVVRSIDVEGVFYGQVIEINGRTVLLARVEPMLYADRAGEFVRALGELRPARRRGFFFTGTVGGLESGMAVQDLVVPSSFGDANGLGYSEVSGVHNIALDYLARADLSDRTGIYAGGRLGAVDSILSEDRSWMNSHTRGDSALRAVEQEGAGIAEAVRDHNADAVRASTSRIDVGAVYRVSDIPGSEGFTINENNRPTARSGMSQGDIIVPMVIDYLSRTPR